MDYKTEMERMLAQQLQMKLEMMENRLASNDPIRAYEMVVTLGRGEYRQLCEYALIGVRHELKSPS